MDVALIAQELLDERRHQVAQGYTDEHDRKKGSYHVAAEASNRLSELVFRVDRASVAPERHELIQIMTMLASAIHTIDYYESHKESA